MTKELGSKLASSIRQAKTKQPLENKPDIQQTQELPKTEKPLPLLPARRVWPD